MSDETPPIIHAPATVIPPEAVADPAREADRRDAKELRIGDQTALLTGGQRRINLLWEVTQALIALAVTIATLVASVSLVLRGDGGTAAFLLLSNAFFLIIGTYFNRTNHTRVGGIKSDAER